MARTLVAPVSFGLGDLVVSLPIIQALVAEGHRAGREVWLVARAPTQRLLAPRIAGLGGCVDEGSLELEGDDRLVDPRAHPLQRDHWWGSPTFKDVFGDIDVNELLDRISADLGVHADFSRPVPLVHEVQHGLSSTVVLVHETDGPNKAWTPERWQALAAALESDGHEVRQITRSVPSPAMRATGIDTIVAATPGEAVDVLSSCRAVVGIDTGLTHIAVQQGTPTVTICRRDTVYVRPWPNSVGARGDPCTPACLEVDRAYAYNAQVGLAGFDPGPRVCPSEQACLASVTPERVLAILADLL